MGLKFQNFLKISYFFPKFSKKGTLRGTDFSILVFLRPYLGLVKVKKGTLTSGASPYPFLPKYPPGFLPCLELQMYGLGATKLGAAFIMHHSS